MEKLFIDWLFNVTLKLLFFAEKLTRFRIFQKNLQKIKLLNDHERGTAKYGVTKFADWTGIFCYYI